MILNNYCDFNLIFPFNDFNFIKILKTFFSSITPSRNQMLLKNIPSPVTTNILLIG